MAVTLKQLQIFYARLDEEELFTLKRKFDVYLSSLFSKKSINTQVAEDLIYELNKKEIKAKLSIKKGGFLGLFSIGFNQDFFNELLAMVNNFDINTNRIYQLCNGDISQLRTKRPDLLHQAQQQEKEKEKEKTREEKQQKNTGVHTVSSIAKKDDQSQQKKYLNRSPDPRDKVFDTTAQQAAAFRKIYKALRDGQTNLFGFKTNNLPYLEKIAALCMMFGSKNESNGNDFGLWTAVCSYKDKHKKSRTRKAWKLAKKHYAQCDDNNIALFRKIYVYSFDHSNSWIRGSNVTNKFFKSTADLQKKMETRSDNKIRDKLKEIAMDPKKASCRSMSILKALK
jgi:hypothetical protein